ncbi:MAG: hypothetical protein JWN38_200 [Candidatus Saccharibacteria bacterium]|nr:hypothetical protein [Candidatus Saccharibacteria bacterium]
MSVSAYETFPEPPLADSEAKLQLVEPPLEAQVENQLRDWYELDRLSPSQMRGFTRDAYGLINSAYTQASEASDGKRILPLAQSYVIEALNEHYSSYRTFDRYDKPGTQSAIAARQAKPTEIAKGVQASLPEIATALSLQQHFASNQWRVAADAMGDIVAAQGVAFTQTTLKQRDVATVRKAVAIAAERRRQQNQ